MATTKVQGTYQTATGSKAFASNVSAGNLLTARIVWQGSAGITLNSVTDTQGNTWTIHATTLQRHPTLTQYMQIASCNAGSSAACTVTATLSSGTAKSIAIDEWNNAAGQLAFDAGSANSGTSPNLNSGSATTTAANDLGTGMCAADASLGGSFTTPDAGWTDQQSYTSYWYANDLFQLDLGASGSESCGETLVSGASKNWMANFAAFKVSAGGGGDVSLALTGQGATIALGNLKPATSIALTGQSVTSSQGTLKPANSVAITGQSLTGTQGALSPQTAGNITLALTGQVLTGSQGNLAPANSVAIAGQNLTSAQGSLKAATSIALSGQSLTGSQGTLSPAATGQSITIRLTGQALSLTQGSLDLSEYIWDTDAGRAGRSRGTFKPLPTEITHSEVVVVDIPERESTYEHHPITNVKPARNGPVAGLSGVRLPRRQIRQAQAPQPQGRDFRKLMAEAGNERKTRKLSDYTIQKDKKYLTKTRGPITLKGN